MRNTDERFYEGDRVVCIKDHPDGNVDIVKGFTGTVCNEDAGSVGVRWDCPIDGGHSCSSTCEIGYGWYVDETEIELLSCEEFVYDEDKFASMLFAAGSEEV